MDTVVLLHQGQRHVPFPAGVEARALQGVLHDQVCRGLQRLQVAPGNGSRDQRRVDPSPILSGPVAPNCLSSSALMSIRPMDPRGAGAAGSRSTSRSSVVHRPARACHPAGCGCPGSTLVPFAVRVSPDVLRLLRGGGGGADLLLDFPQPIEHRFPGCPVTNSDPSGCDCGDASSASRSRRRSSSPPLRTGTPSSVLRSEPGRPPRSSLRALLPAPALAGSSHRPGSASRPDRLLSP